MAYLKTLKKHFLLHLFFLVSGTVLAFPIYTLMVMGPINFPATNQFYTNVSTAWSNTFTASGGTGVFTYTLPVSPGGATVNASTGQVDYTPASAGTYSFTIRATDSGGTQKDHSFTLEAYTVGVCLWTGATSSTWGTASNWQLCGGLAPTSGSDVAIYSGASYMPIIVGNTTVNSFGAGPGGGTITVNAAVTFTITAATNSIRSSVKFQGGVTTCTTCGVLGTSSLEVVDGAVVTLLKGINFSPNASASILLGNGTTGGHLATGAAGASNEWPAVGAMGTSGRFIYVNGGSSNRSSVDLDGLKIRTVYGSGLDAIRFNDWYEVKKFDKVSFSNFSTNVINASVIKFVSCTNAVVTDTSWSDIDFAVSIYSGAYNIRADGTNCSTLPVITVSNTAGTSGGIGYGPVYELDPNNKINWSNSSASSCVWNGSVDTSWINASNWSTCTNGRGNYPDQLDTVLIPVTATQPVVAANTVVGGFATGAGGGTITVNAGYSLIIANTTNSIRSDVKFQGSPSTCTTCYVAPIGDLEIVDGATVTLKTGINLYMQLYGSRILKVGNGTTHGVLKTDPADVSSTKWPTINLLQDYLIVQGSSSQSSVIDFDGIKLTGYFYGVTAVRFQDWYNIQKFDNVTLTGQNSQNTTTAIRFYNCTNATITDTSWDNMTFSTSFAGSFYNIQADGTNCSTLPVITVSNVSGTSGGIGYGPVFELDPNNKINWSNSTSFACTWTGATNSSWTTTTNWTGCTNGRANYPDQLDTAIIPVTVTQPTITALTIVGGFGTGVGGGTITVNSNVSLLLAKTSSTIQSDIQFQGATTTCSNCYVVGSGHIKITDAAKLTLLKGITLSTPAWTSGGLYVGDGTTAGQLYTGNAGLSTEWPRIDMTGNIGLFANGVSSQRSIIYWDGIKILGAYASSSNDVITLQDWYDIKKFDNVYIDSTYSLASGKADVKFASCTNALMTSTTWLYTNFVDARGAGGYNIRADGTNCSTLPEINMYQATGSGAGATYELDPNTKINWTNVFLTGASSYFTNVGTAWSQGFTASGGTPAYTYSLQTSPGGASIDSVTGVVSYTPATAGQYTFTVRATESGPGTYTDFTFTLDVYAAAVCVWNGSTSTSWTTAANWSNCGGLAPTAASDVAITSSGIYSPIVAANTTVNSFGLGPGGGTVTVNVGVTLTLTATTNTIRSSVKFQGSVSTCVNCNINGPAGGFYITGGSTVSLLKGIRFYSNSTTLGIGDGTTSGNLVTVNTGTSSEWPTVRYSTISVSGTASTKSVIDFDGVNLLAAGANTDQFLLTDWYEIKKFDNVNWPTTANSTGNGSFLKFVSCTNATITDTTWSGMTISPAVTSYGTRGDNIRANGTNCNTLPVISIANAGTTGGLGYGSVYENDPSSKLTWANSTTFTCTWTGAVDSSWTNPSNWSGCTNGRSNYPDQIDEVIIPSGPPTQPIITANTLVKGFAASGLGGGTITVNAGIYFILPESANTILSDVKFQGATTTCTNCIVYGYGTLRTNNNATVTLLKGIKLQADTLLEFGNGTTGGILKTGPAGTSAEWPTVATLNSSSLMTFNGASGNISKVDWDGINVYNNGGNIDQVVFQNYYEIVNFDNVSHNGAGGTGGASNYRFTSCTNGTVTDTSWSNITFVNNVTAYGTVGYNINASGTNCSTLPAISISNVAGTNGGFGYGADFESDPNNKLSWANSTGSTCVWNGSVSSVWTNPSNWTSCTNGRGNYADQLDTVTIPSTAPTQPIITSKTVISKLGAGTGGGTVTINASMQLVMMATTGTIQSDITFQGNTTTCTTCGVMSMSHFEITNNAVVTLQKGIYLGSDVGSVKIGDGTTGGKLATGAAGLSTEWPVIRNNANRIVSIELNGASGQNAILKADGMKMNNFNGGSYLKLVDWYELEQFDNFSFAGSGGAYGAAGRSYIQFVSCTNATITDTTWTAPNFASTLGGVTNYNVNASGTNCSTLPTISISGATGTSACTAVGSGACTYENDPSSKIDWN